MPERQKKHVRISPLMLGKLGDIAAEVTLGAVIVQFAGQCVRFTEGEEWHVTHAVLSNSLDVADAEARQAHNREVEQVVREGGLSHIGWLRQVSDDCPLSALDIDTQRVYETHTRDAFAAMLDIADSPSGPCLFFYCLASGPGSSAPGTWRSTTFMPAHHIILDSTIPYNIITCSASLPTHGKSNTTSASGSEGPTSRNSSDSSASEVGQVNMDLSR